MKHGEKPRRRPSKADLPAEQLQRPSDIAPEAARGGDKESRESLPRREKGVTQPQTTPSRKPTR